MTYPNIALDTISEGQDSKEVTANNMAEAESPAALFGCRANTTTGLTFGYYGGVMWVDGVLTSISSGTVLLTGSTTNYVESTRAGVVSANTTSFTAGRIPLYTITTTSSAIDTVAPSRAFVDPKYITHGVSVSITTTDVTLTAAQARCKYISLTGTLTGNRNLFVPNSGEWVVINNTSGAYDVTVKTSAGTGDLVAQGENRIFYADGTNVIALTTGGVGSIQIDDLADVNTAGAADGDVLTYDTGTGQWVAAASGTNPTQCIAIACSDETTALTTGTAKVTFRMPFAFTLTGIRASLTTAQSSGSIFTVDVNESGTTILSTKITIDNTEKTSTTAVTAPVISDSSLADDAEITVDIDQVGDGTAKGLKVYLIGTKT
jgi:hypothetical protein